MKSRFIKSENIFANCKKCDRPYKKGENYPDEVCTVCVKEDEIGDED